MLKDGLYEQVINNKLDTELAECADKLSTTASIDKAEASKVLSKYLTAVVEKGLDNIIDNGGDISSQVELVNKIVSVIKSIDGNGKVTCVSGNCQNAVKISSYNTSSVKGFVSIEKLA